MKSITVLLLLLVVVNCFSEREYQREFEKFIKKYNKKYSNEDFPIRYKNFKNTLALITEENLSQNDYTLGITKFADLNEEEFRRNYANANPSRNPVMPKYKVLDTSNLPNTVDWREKGAVTPVETQYECASDWAVSTTEAVEGLHFILEGTLIGFSPQQMVDCDTNEGQINCNGGYIDFEYIKENGIETGIDYPYTGVAGNCAYNPADVVYYVTGSYDVPVNDSMQLAAAVAQQPVSIYLNGASYLFQTYTGGIVTSPQCGTDSSHAVLIVGYANNGTTDYWIVKNSWGTDFGLDGYIYIMKSNEDGPGICGVAVNPSYPTNDQ